MAGRPHTLDLIEHLERQRSPRDGIADCNGDRRAILGPVVEGVQRDYVLRSFPEQSVPNKAERTGRNRHTQS